MKVLPLAGLAFAVFGIQSLQAVTITFNDFASFDDNFYKPPGATGAALLAQSDSSLHFTPASGQTVAAAIYNSPNTSGSGGTGGTELQAPLNTFTIDSTGLIFSADYKSINSFDGANGLGFYFGLNSDATSGEVVLFRLSTVTGTHGNADVRFDSNANATTAGAGSVGASNPFGTTAGLGLQLDTYYTFQLTVVLNGSNVDMTAKMFDAATGTQLGSTVTGSIAASSITATNGQVGFRVGGVGSPNGYGDVANFTVAAIPEPAVVGLVLLGLTVVLFRIPRTRKC